MEKGQDRPALVRVRTLGPLSLSISVFLFGRGSSALLRAPGHARAGAHAPSPPSLAPHPNAFISERERACTQGGLCSRIKRRGASTRTPSPLHSRHGPAPAPPRLLPAELVAGQAAGDGARKREREKGVFFWRVSLSLQPTRSHAQPLRLPSPTQAATLASVGLGLLVAFQERLVSAKEKKKRENNTTSTSLSPSPFHFTHVVPISFSLSLSLHSSRPITIYTSTASRASPTRLHFTRTG